jgi:hypothetical protein
VDQNFLNTFLYGAIIFLGAIVALKICTRNRTAEGIVQIFPIIKNQRIFTVREI